MKKLLTRMAASIVLLSAVGFISNVWAFEIITKVDESQLILF